MSNKAQTERSTGAITGGCFCGAVTYAYDGTLKDARSCHCSRCRKAFNAQASAYALIDDDLFRFVTGEDELTTYSNEGGFGLQFCKRCGSTLCGVYQGDVHGLTLGCIDGDPPVKLERHIFVASKASWETIPTGVPSFEEHPPECPD